MVVLGIMLLSIVMLIVGLIFLTATIICAIVSHRNGKKRSVATIILTVFTVVFLGIPLLFYGFLFTVNNENKKDNEQNKLEQSEESYEEAQESSVVNEDYVWSYVPLTNWEQSETDTIELGNLDDDEMSNLLELYAGIKEGTVDISDQITIPSADVQRRGGLQKIGSNGDVETSIDFVEYNGAYYVDLTMVVDVTKLETGLSETTMDVYPIPEDLGDYIDQLLQ